MKTNRGVSVVVILLLGIHAGLLAYGSYVHSPCIDEVGHLPAGLSHWQLGRFGLYRVNPPLVRMVAALPVLAAGAKTDWSKYSEAPGARPEFEIGREFISANGYRSFWLFTISRWACIPFSLLGGYVCFRWARELYGPPAGLLALVLWCSCPNILANGQMITPDTGATALGLSACYLFWHWLRQPSWSQAFVVGVVLGLTELTKATWVVLFALWPAIWFGWRVTTPRSKPRAWFRESLQGLLIFALGVYVLNVGYGFEGTFTRLREFEFVSPSLGTSVTATEMHRKSPNRFSETWLGTMPLPLPRNYVLGVDHQKRDFEVGIRSYLHGEWRDRGWWYYYLYALAIKVPLGTWLLLACAVFDRSSRLIRRRSTENALQRTWRDEMILLAPLAVILTFVSSQTGFSHHLRYVLPIFPFAYVWTSQIAFVFAETQRFGRVITHAFRWFASVALVWSIASSLWIYPHSLSYFNELVGGPANGQNHLVDSNIDWGQDLLYLKQWMDRTPEAKPISLAYFGAFDPRLAVIDAQLPRKQRDRSSGDSASEELALAPSEWFAVSVSVLEGIRFPVHGKSGGTVLLMGSEYERFRSLDPFARVGYSIYIFRLNGIEPDDPRNE